MERQFRNGAFVTPPKDNIATTVIPDWTNIPNTTAPTLRKVRVKEDYHGIVFCGTSGINTFAPVVCTGPNKSFTLRKGDVIQVTDFPSGVMYGQMITTASLRVDGITVNVPLNILEDVPAGTPSRVVKFDEPQVNGPKPWAIAAGIFGLSLLVGGIYYLSRPKNAKK